MAQHILLMSYFGTDAIEDKQEDNLSGSGAEVQKGKRVYTQRPRRDPREVVIRSLNVSSCMAFLTFVAIRHSGLQSNFL